MLRATADYNCTTSTAVCTGLTPRRTDVFTKLESALGRIVNSAVDNDGYSKSDLIGGSTGTHAGGKLDNVTSAYFRGVLKIANDHPSLPGASYLNGINATNAASRSWMAANSDNLLTALLNFAVAYAPTQADIDAAAKVKATANAAYAKQQVADEAAVAAAATAAAAKAAAAAALTQNQANAALAQAQALQAKAASDAAAANALLTQNEADAAANKAAIAQADQEATAAQTKTTAMTKIAIGAGVVAAIAAIWGFSRHS